MRDFRRPPGRRFEDAYREGRPPWDIGRPQPEVLRLLVDRDIVGDVLDAGCGTGENAMAIAAVGHGVMGIDGVRQAIDRARGKAAERRLRARFLVHDALDLEALDLTFDTVLDCGLFHTFTDEKRARYERSVHAALRPGGRLFVLCFSEHQPGTEGPRRVTQDELRATFARGWEVRWIREARFESLSHPGGAHAWLAAFSRLGEA